MRVCGGIGSNSGGGVGGELEGVVSVLGHSGPSSNGFQVGATMKASVSGS